MLLCICISRKYGYSNHLFWLKVWFGHTLWLHPSGMILACIYAQSLSSLNSAWSGLSELDFDDSIYSVEFHASKILLLITGTWKSSWKFYTVPKIHNQSSGTGGSRYSCWRVPVNCTGSSYVDLLNSMDSVNSRFRLPSPHLLPRCGDLGVQPVS